MLSDEIIRKLTAYVDGELSRSEREAVRRLVRRSTEARALLQQLERNASAVRRLPRRTLPANFSQRVVRAIETRKLRIRQTPVSASSGPLPSWAGFAAAAAVLLIVFGGSYFYFYTNAVYRHERSSGTMAQETERNPSKSVAPNLSLPKDGPEEKPEVPDNHPPVPPPLEKKPPRKEAPVKVVERMPKPEPEIHKPEPLPEPRIVKLQPSAPPVVELTKPSRRLEIFQEIPELPDLISLTLRELEKRDAEIRLQAELQKVDAYRVEVFSLGTTIDFERLRKTFEQHKISLLIDEMAKYRLSRKGLVTDIAFYKENLTAEELVSILRELGKADRKLAAVVMPLSQDDHKELSNLLGVDPEKLGPPKPFGVDIRKPISETTLKQLRTAPPRPKPGIALHPRKALVVAVNPVRPDPAASKEIQAYLERRGKRQPKTIQQLLFVVRGVSGS
ncbi:MAG: hypothetical protein KatS3mg105_1800 [Gemmatales bacterium]|nr:MAG: hypothetical protein KatS3mg105_1800 [Gemmatales bacterium]